VLDGDQLFGATASKNLTFARIKAVSSGWPEAHVNPRGFSIRSASHDVLVEDVEVDRRYWFKARLEGSGMALSRVAGRLRSLTGRAVDSVLTDLTVLSPKPLDPSPEALTGERVIGWRINLGQAAPPSTPNLYEAQRR
jgi:hypothetical protein